MEYHGKLAMEICPQNGAYKESPGGESPGLPSDSTHVNQQQLNFHLSVHGLRDVESDD